MFRTALLLVLLATTSLQAADVPDAAGYAKAVEPFFKAYCNECHTGEKPKGEFRTDAKSLSADFLDAATKGKWRKS